MNQKYLVKEIAKDLKENKQLVEEVITLLLDKITSALASNEKVRLVGFGVFEVRARTGRHGRNPQTGERIFIPDTKTPTFVAGKNLKNKVKGRAAN